MEALNCRFGRKWFEEDGDGAVGQHLRKLTYASECLGREDVAFVGAIAIPEATLEAVGEDGAENGIPGTSARAEGDLTFVEEEGGKIDGICPAGEGGGGEAGGGRRPLAEQAEKMQAKSFAGLLVLRADVEVRSSPRSRKAVAMEYPESEDGTLMLRAVEIASQEIGDLPEQLSAVGGWGFRWLGSV